jgi:hypothetical protein
VLGSCATGGVGTGVDICIPGIGEAAGVDAGFSPVGAAAGIFMSGILDEQDAPAPLAQQLPPARAVLAPRARNEEPSKAKVSTFFINHLSMFM